MSQSHFDQQIRDWSARKHAILEEYLPAFCRALSRRSFNKTIWYIDAYAGAGIYKDPSDLGDLGSPGSPIRAAQVTQQLPYDIRCLNVEENSSNFARLQVETASFTHVENIHADFNDVIDDVLQRIRDSPAFFFLDPFGIKDLPMEGLIDRIAMRTEKTDILVRYATETVRRLAGAFEKGDARGNAQARNLDNWFRGYEWRMILQEHPVGPMRDEELLTYYKEQLVSISGGRLEFAKDYPLRSVIDGQIKYHLVFATGNPLGVKIMSDILYKAKTIYQSDHEAHQQQIAGPYNQLDMFAVPTPDAAIQQAQHIENIQEAILYIGQNIKQNWKFYELYYELIINQNWFACFSEKEFRSACKALYSQSQIKRLTPGNAWKKDTHFRIEPDP